MLRVGAQIQRIARGLGFESGLRLARIKAKWNTIFSGPVALHAWPVFFERKTLTIIVDSSAWMQQLSFLKDEMVEKLSEFEVKDIKFRTGQLRGKPKVVTESKPNLRELDAEDKTFISSETGRLNDEELKASLEKAMKAWAKRNNKKRK